MSGVMPGRFTARVEGDYVVFLIGMRVNRVVALPPFLAMPSMLETLMRNPEKGYLAGSSSCSGPA